MDKGKDSSFPSLMVHVQTGYESKDNKGSHDQCDLAMNTCYKKPVQFLTSNWYKNKVLWKEKQGVLMNLNDNILDWARIM